MELSSITASNREFAVNDPRTDEPTGIVFILRPDSHEEVRKFDRNWTNQQLRRGRGKTLTAEQLEARNVGRTIVGVEGWKWGKDFAGVETTWHGEKPEFNETNLRAVLKALPWLQKLLDDELGNDAAFLQS